MCVSISQVSRFRINLLGGTSFHGWFKNNSTPPKLLDIRASSSSSSSVNNNSKSRWVRRNVSTTTQGSRSNTKSSILGGAVPPVTTRIVDAESTTTKIQQQPFGNLQQRLAENKDLSSLLTVIVSDLETTGLHRVKERIIEIAAQDLAGGENSTFQTLVNPGVPILNASIHGIRNDMVCRPEVPRYIYIQYLCLYYIQSLSLCLFIGCSVLVRMEEMIPIFLRYVQSRQKKPGGYVMIVAHNGKTFDFQFLINEFNRCSYEIPPNWLFFDSLPLARESMKSVGNMMFFCLLYLIGFDL